MREIKFRFWDETLDRMRTWGYMLTNINMQNVFTYEMFSKYLMQYTGMKDKNDVEIYEGDIVEYVNEDGDKSYYEVKFHNGSWAVICPNCMPDWLDGEQHTFAVVGNIYENQDLLK